MPTYSYRCTACSHAFDIQQAFTDDALTVCPDCGGVLRKVFSPVGVTFSGSGFYRTDSRTAPKESGSGSESAKTESTKTDSTKTDSTKTERTKTESTSASTSTSTTD